MGHGQGCGHEYRHGHEYGLASPTAPFRHEQGFGFSQWQKNIPIGWLSELLGIYTTQQALVSHFSSTRWAVSFALLSVISYLFMSLHFRWTIQWTPLRRSCGPTAPTNNSKATSATKNSQFVLSATSSWQTSMSWRASIVTLLDSWPGRRIYSINVSTYQFYYIHDI